MLWLSFVTTPNCKLATSDSASGILILLVVCPYSGIGASSGDSVFFGINESINGKPLSDEQTPATE